MGTPFAFPSLDYCADGLCHYHESLLWLTKKLYFSEMLGRFELGDHVDKVFHIMRQSSEANLTYFDTLFESLLPPDINIGAVSGLVACIDEYGETFPEPYCTLEGGLALKMVQSSKVGTPFRDRPFHRLLQVMKESSELPFAYPALLEKDL